MILLIDNYDSFTWNVYQLLCAQGGDVEVVRNDEVTVDEVAAGGYSAIVISPGPGAPDGAGISLEVVRTLGDRVPILGVCLGMQCIGEAYGGSIIRAGELRHGKTSAVTHDGLGIYAGLPSPFSAVRYHSLVVDRATLPASLKVTATTANGLIMGLRHREHLVEGMQFHPESILTEHGAGMVANFMRAARLPARTT